jgi:hypothetical protein
MTEHNMSMKKCTANPTYLRHLEVGDIFSRETDCNVWLLYGVVYSKADRLYTVVAIHDLSESDLHMGISYTLADLISIGYVEGPSTPIKIAHKFSCEVLVP